MQGSLKTLFRKMVLFTDNVEWFTRWTNMKSLYFHTCLKGYALKTLTDNQKHMKGYLSFIDIDMYKN